MRITKPLWVSHLDNKNKRTTLFCLHIHPDGSRLATGGIDAKIRIWSTLPILSEPAEKNDANHKLLSTLSNHNGPVLSVRWAHHGRYLASGSDDGIVLIWDHDLYGGGRVFGSDEVNVESWRPKKRLVGHASDVVDIAWNRDDSMIASVGLDSTVFIWDGFTFDLIRKIEGHQGFVKGVCWDPVGEYLATQSDDRTVKVWNTSDWSLAKSIEEPFTHSPGSTFFRRLSWSPDGSFIAASNAMNGPIFVAAVIDRHAWSTNISFVGHENTIQVASFNPILLFPPGCEKKASEASSMLALGSDDNSISVWRNNAPLPIFVIKDCFDRQILDLCWSSNGLTMYGCSSDGTILAVDFDSNELPDLGATEDTTRIIDGHASKVSTRKASHRPVTIAQQLPRTNPGGLSNSQPTVNILQARKGPQKSSRLPNGKRRIQPGLLQSSTSSGMTTTGADYSKRLPLLQSVNGSGAADAFAAAADQPLESQSNVIQSREDIVQNAASAFARSGYDAEDVRDLPTGTEESRGQKRKTVDDWEPQSRYVRPRTLGGGPGGDRARGSELTAEVQLRKAILIGEDGPEKIRPLIRVSAEDEETLMVEAENGDDDAPSKVSVFHKGVVQWLDFPSGKIVDVAICSYGVACALGQGNIILYSAAGVRLIPLQKLQADISLLAAAGSYAIAIAGDLLYGWDLQRRQALFEPVSISHFVDKSDVKFHNVVVRPNGTPLIQLDDGNAYAYDKSVNGFIQVCSSWWAEHSPYWTRTRASNVPAKSIIAGLETTLNTLRPDITSAAEASGSKPKAKWWNDAIPLGHLEERLYACVLISSPTEYRSFLTLYARKLADEGYRNKAEQLVKDLFGPISYNAANRMNYSPTVCGTAKKDLLKEVLAIFAKTRSLADLAQIWQDRLKLSASES